MPINPKKHEMPTQAAEVRAHNFKEVALGYEMKTAVDEAARCLNCKNKPCVQGCPVNISIPEFIGCIKKEDFQGAYDVITKSSSLPAVCGRVCPQETQCESKCTLGVKFEPVGIGRLERFVADWHNAQEDVAVTVPEPNGHKVAVVGSGPSGLTCAGDLAKKGYKVSVFEALHTAGGVLVYGIPEFRLPKSIVAKEVEGLKKLGVDIETNVVIGKTLTIDELFGMGYEAVFVGSGAGLPNFMGIPGEALKGVYSANEFLTRSNLMKAYESDPDTPIMKGGNVAVVGGGNVAMDAARTALRLGAEHVYIVYRRSLKELPARKEEVEHAMEEGIDFRLLNNPVEILGYSNPDDPRDPKNGFVTGMKCIKMELGEPDAKGRRRPVPIEGSEFVLDVDTVIMAIGTSPNPLIKNTTKGLEVNAHGGIIVNEDGLTSRTGVYAGGDAVTGAATVISAMGAGKVAAKAIDEYLSAKN
ncbi:MAG: NADPH-dependent glutamate synthase [Bullifex sp.]|nr:NADPH-dependent glutamate synthase [Spirochaetales bacterium]MDY3850963.1 NADPH-dependent glutamate synthase [Bullifex sp.]MDD7535698.1 NADPH-dependent glutamate synthase [Spirochaetales bacterium]MDY4798957.1 NADPH-dependent glutamate synthase [Bullifex sp.]MDY5776912.1 NADPH-dependent glutamate synthase [Bullifex sp.]